MAAYQLGYGPNAVKRESDGVWIHPNDPDGGAAWAVYQEWLAAPNTPDPAPPLYPSTPSGNAQVMLLTGFQVASMSTPTVNGTYPCTSAAALNEVGMLAQVAAGISAGPQTVLDTSGNPHAFPNAIYLEYCAAKATFEQTLNTIIGSNSGSLPTQPTTIA